MAKSSEPVSALRKALDASGKAVFEKASYSMFPADNARTSCLMSCIGYDRSLQSCLEYCLVSFPSLDSRE